MQEDKEGFFDTVNTLFICLEIITAFLPSIIFNTDLMNKKAKSGYLDATKLLENMVMDGIPFRDAHHQVGELVSEAIARGCSLNELFTEENK